MNEIRINGVNLNRFGAYLAESTFLNGAQKKTQTWSVPGRNGILSRDYGVFDNMTMNAVVYMRTDSVKSLNALKNFLANLRGFVKYEETNLPNCYRMVRYVQPFIPGKYDGLGGYIELKFDAQPQIWMNDGQQAVSYTESGTIYNYTDNETRPLIRAYGKGDIVINGKRISVYTPGRKYIDIDCDSGLVYEGSANRAQNIGLANYELPTLTPGENTINLAGGIRIDLTPRWYRV